MITYRQLEVVAAASAREAGITDYTWTSFTERLAALRLHSPATYAHSLRVGLYAYGIATAEGWDDRSLPLMGGCGHDMGKCRVPLSVLETTEPLSEAEWALIRRHPADGHEMLRDKFPYTAMVAGLHHAFTPRAYGVEMADAPAWLPARSAHKIIEATLVVMICDTFDALSTRRNASTVVDPDDTRAVIERLGNLFTDWPDRVRFLGEHLI